MARTLSYADAVRILGGGPQSPTFQRINNLTGGLLLAATVSTPALLGLIDARSELARLSTDLVNGLSSRLTGASRRERTERIAAAHTVIVIAAFFEAAAAAPVPPGLLGEISRDDQIRLGGGSPGNARDLATALLTTGLAVPEPHVGHDEFVRRLKEVYTRTTTHLVRFLSGLAGWDDLGEHDQDGVRRALAGIVPDAQQRYERMLFDLTADCPDMALWVDQRDRRDLAAKVASWEPALLEFHRLIARTAARPAPAEVVDALRRSYAAMLERRIVESADLPDGFDVPTLGQSYVSPAFALLEPGRGQSAVDERVWADAEVRQDLDRYLAAYLMSPRAQQVPLVVLGQPGAGKSVLTKVLAARLSDSDFLPVRVALRDVDSSRDLQRQIEQAIHAATGEEAGWPELVRSTDALPVVIIDGFDELLQATELNQTDYLYTVTGFQERERTQGRAVAVLVTSRTSVADRALTPPETVLLRLQPFDTARIDSWLSTWNQVNGARLEALGRTPLTPEVVLTHPDLATQPLLLFLLALYDAETGGLRQAASALSLSDLYERLLLEFARREVRKKHPRVERSQLDMLASHELDRLAIVAFAMVNRSAQWVTEDAVARDLEAVFREDVSALNADALSESELLFGRFFFIHHARAIRHGRHRRTYEFLHATFGEYLVAHFTWKLLGEAVARATMTTAHGDAVLTDLLSYAPLTVRASTVKFLGEMAARLSAAERESWRTAVHRLYRTSRRDVWPDSPSTYRPAPAITVAARYAAWTANLTLLAVVLDGSLLFSELVGETSSRPARAWHDQALLWHSQLNDEGWDTLVATLAVRTVNRTDVRVADIAVSLEDGSFVTPPVDPLWLLSLHGRTGDKPFAEGHSIEVHRRRIHMQGGWNDAVLVHAMAPLLDSRLGASVSVLFPGEQGVPSAAQALLAVWVLAGDHVDPVRATAAYERCATIAVSSVSGWDTAARQQYARQLLAALAGHHDAPASAALAVLTKLAERFPDASTILYEPLVRTAAAVRHRTDDPGLRAGLDEFTDSLRGQRRQ
ncbi:NACHT domain-containing protein [Actinoplanes sp. RD1]|uniref:NACHT domain-containing protein n=1 Tax=Actinoplanes sp. RD1 TaxID=3064538 RepID=UPI002741A7E3|nr:ATP-binding protein [Actinoplanes sp. RD1]